ncbi:MAG: MgtC/SapB family protein [Nanoarchaeota archaeon]|nr:MgtC/SapB family protein [Nanoarchaeota archaeon]
MVNIETILFRFILVFILSFIFGIGRQKSHKPVGFGTFIFVALGACSLALIAIEFRPDDPLPLLGAIVTGIGFLGAGALIKTSDKIFGFTSAATIWIFAIFGLTIGTGEYLIGIIIYLLIGVVIIYDSHLEKKGMGSYQKKLMITTNKIIGEKEIKNILTNTTKHKLNSIEVDKKNKKISFIYLIEGTKEQINKIPKELFEKDWFETCKVE